MSAPSRIRHFFAFAVALLLPASASFALRPDELLLIVNDNVPESRELAEFYTAARLVPAGRIVGLKLTDADEMTFDAYERDVVPAVRKFLRDNKLEAQVKCLVTFYGVPLRVAGKVSSPGNKLELAQVRRELADARAALDVAVGEAEVLAKSLDAGFAPPEPNGNVADEAGRRADAAMRTGLLALADMPDAARRRETAEKVVALLQRLGGGQRVAELLNKSQGLKELVPPQPASTAGAVAAVQAELERLQELRYDAEARGKLRELASGSFGLFGQVRALQAQADYLDNDGTSAAVDSELALLWWNYYNRTKWQPNALHHLARPVGVPPVMMTARLDAPKPETVREMILASLKAERDGLSGKIAIDSRGIPVAGEAGKNPGYGQYDETLRRLAERVRTKTKLPLVFDEREEIFGGDAAKDVALYCGWYRLRSYARSFTFVPGAVGFHVASLEMVSLRRANEGGWVAGLLNDGVVATTGAVAEPYLHAFPPADEFFPLVMTGKLTLAEAYWRTTLMTSWMMSLVGDPLYRPFATNPALRPEDLPGRLRRANPIGAPATSPTTAPTTTPTTTPTLGGPVSAGLFPATPEQIH